MLLLVLFGVLMSEHVLQAEMAGSAETAAILDALNSQRADARERQAAMERQIREEARRLRGGIAGEAHVTLWPVLLTMRQGYSLHDALQQLMILTFVVTALACCLKGPYVVLPALAYTLPSYSIAVFCPGLLHCDSICLLSVTAAGFVVRL